MSWMYDGVFLCQKLCVNVPFNNRYVSCDLSNLVSLVKCICMYVCLYTCMYVFIQVLLFMYLNYELLIMYYELWEDNIHSFHSSDKSVFWIFLMENLKTKSGESVPFFITGVLYYIYLIYIYILQLKLVAVWVCSNRGHYTVTKPTQKLLNDMLHNNHQLEISALIEKKNTCPFQRSRNKTPEPQENAAINTL